MNIPASTHQHSRSISCCGLAKPIKNGMSNLITAITNIALRALDWLREVWTSMLKCLLLRSDDSLISSQPPASNPKSTQITDISSSQSNKEKQTSNSHSSSKENSSNQSPTTTTQITDISSSQSNEEGQTSNSHSSSEENSSNQSPTTIKPVPNNLQLVPQIPKLKNISNIDTPKWSVRISFKKINNISEIYETFVRLREEYFKRQPKQIRELIGQSPVGTSTNSQLELANHSPSSNSNEEALNQLSIIANNLDQKDLMLMPHPNGKVTVVLYSPEWSIRISFNKMSDILEIFNSFAHLANKYSITQAHRSKKLIGPCPMLIGPCPIKNNSMNSPQKQPAPKLLAPPFHKQLRPDPLPVELKNVVAIVKKVTPKPKDHRSISISENHYSKVSISANDINTPKWSVNINFKKISNISEIYNCMMRLRAEYLRGHSKEIRKLIGWKPSSNAEALNQLSITTVNSDQNNLQLIPHPNGKVTVVLYSPEWSVRISFNKISDISEIFKSLSHLMKEYSISQPKQSKKLIGPCPNKISSVKFPTGLPLPTPTHHQQLRPAPLPLELKNVVRKVKMVIPKPKVQKQVSSSNGPCSDKNEAVKSVETNQTITNKFLFKKEDLESLDNLANIQNDEVIDIYENGTVSKPYPKGWGASTWRTAKWISGYSGNSADIPNIQKLIQRVFIGFLNVDNSNDEKLVEDMLNKSINGLEKLKATYETNSNKKSVSDITEVINNINNAIIKIKSEKESPDFKPNLDNNAEHKRKMLNLEASVFSDEGVRHKNEGIDYYIDKIKNMLSIENETLNEGEKTILLKLSNVLINTKKVPCMNWNFILPLADRMKVKATGYDEEVLELKNEKIESLLKELDSMNSDDQENLGLLIPIVFRWDRENKLGKDGHMFCISLCKQTDGTYTASQINAGAFTMGEVMKFNLHLNINCVYSTSRPPVVEFGPLDRQEATDFMNRVLFYTGLDNFNQNDEYFAFNSYNLAENSYAEFFQNVKDNQLPNRIPSRRDQVTGNCGLRSVKEFIIFCLQKSNQVDLANKLMTYGDNRQGQSSLSFDKVEPLFD